MGNTQAKPNPSAAVTANVNAKRRGPAGPPRRQSASPEIGWRPPRAAAPPHDGACPLLALPRELLVHILSFVGEETVTLSCVSTCRHLNEISQDDFLWRSLLAQDFPQPRPVADSSLSSSWDAPAKKKSKKSKEIYYERAREWYGAIEAGEYEGYTSRANIRFKIDGKVYAVSKFLDDHPGGEDILLEYAGKDASEVFADVGHSNEAKKMMAQYLVESDETQEQKERRWTVRAAWYADLSQQRKKKGDKAEA